MKQLNGKIQLSKKDYREQKPFHKKKITGSVKGSFFWTLVLLSLVLGNVG